MTGLGGYSCFGLSVVRGQLYGVGSLLTFLLWSLMIELRSRLQPIQIQKLVNDLEISGRLECVSELSMLLFLCPFSIPTS